MTSARAVALLASAWLLLASGAAAAAPAKGALASRTALVPKSGAAAPAKAAAVKPARKPLACGERPPPPEPPKPPPCKPRRNKPCLPPEPPPPPPPPPRATLSELELPPPDKDVARQRAEAFLAALSRQGSEAGLGHLLGGASLISRIYTIENWKIVGRERTRVETGGLRPVRGLLAELERERKRALRCLEKAVLLAAASDDVSTQEVPRDEEQRLFAPVQEVAREISDRFPTIAFLTGASERQYSAIRDPFRRQLTRLGTRGDYTLELDKFWVETVEGRHDPRTRRWPLYVVRLKGKGLDTGQKILPTGDTTGAAAGEVVH